MLKFKKKKLKLEQNQNSEQLPLNKKRRISKQAIKKIVPFVLLGLTHVVIILAIIMSFRYYDIYPELFGSAVALIICLLIIIDITFFVGFNYKDLALKIISLVLASFLFVGGTVGTYAVARINGIVGGILDDGSSNKTEKYSGVFVSCNNKSLDSIESLSNKKVGMLKETTEGLSYIAKSILDENNVNCGIVDTYQSNTELLHALINGDIHAAVLTSAYRDIYKNDENTDIKDYFEVLNDFYQFEKELQIKVDKTKKNLSKEPFNVLLIGWSRTDLGSSVGLADSIIVATINPLTYTVSMMSIARDSFVPIACYGGAYDKINSGRSTSRQCFIETVEDFIGMDIDYYMEADYEAIVYMVNAIGGVEINNPVDFELDGFFVPAGQYVADGWQALEFCRERHHMPNGDFDRQKHQKEVIMAIAKKFIESGDINLALNAMKQASPYMETDFTLNELSTVFNLLLNTKNYTGLNTFDLVDFQNLRITGSGGIKYYSYSMHLPLWVYLIYQGSYDESIGHIYNVMGKYDSYDQINSFEFSARTPYIRPAFYSLDYENKFLFTPDPMPAYWPKLSEYSYAEALEWASANSVSLTVSEFIIASDSRYSAELEGMVYSQSVKYGSLVSENKSGSIVVMGTGEIDDSKIVPNFVDKNYENAVEWARKYGISYSVKYNTSDNYDDADIGKVLSQSVKPYSPVSEISEFVIEVKSRNINVSFNSNGGNRNINSVEMRYGSKYSSYFTDGQLPSPGTKEGYEFAGWYLDVNNELTRVSNSSTVDSLKSIILYAKWNEIEQENTEKVYDIGVVQTCQACRINPPEGQEFDYAIITKKGNVVIGCEVIYKKKTDPTTPTDPTDPTTPTDPTDPPIPTNPENLGTHRG